MGLATFLSPDKRDLYFASRRHGGMEALIFMFPTCRIMGNGENRKISVRVSILLVMNNALLFMLITRHYISHPITGRDMVTKRCFM
jgi:hypothetical protein